MSLHAALDLPGEPDVPLPTHAAWSSGLSRPSIRPAQVERSIRIDPPEIVKRRSASWAGMSVEIVQVTRLLKFEMRSASPEHLLIAYEQGTRQQGETRVEGATTSALKSLKRKLTFVPAGHQFSEWHMPTLQSLFTCFHTDPSEQFGLTDSGNLSSRLLFEQPVLWETVTKLRKLVESACAANQHYAKAVAAVLCHEIGQVVSGHMPPDRPAEGGLAAWQLRLVTEHIEKHLGEYVPPTTLAGLVGLSPHHSCRSFKQSLGSSRCRYHGIPASNRSHTDRLPTQSYIGKPSMDVAITATQVLRIDQADRAAVVLHSGGSPIAIGAGGSEPANDMRRSVVLI
jgi:AraC-like DNA-binding protein